MSHLHLDAFAGISGDMTLAALIDVGADVERLRAGLATLPLAGWDLRVRRVVRQGFAATDVVVDDGSHTHDPEPHAVARQHTHGGHDHEHEHGHGRSHGHGHHHDHGPEEALDHAAHVHPRSETGAHGAGRHHAHPHRNLADCTAIIVGSQLPARAKENATAVFEALARAEAAVHGTTVDEIHFHEVGAVDAIVDITGVCLAIELLGVTSLSCSPLPQGHGFVNTAHGRIPVPGPATVELLRGRPIVPAPVEGEMVTPTGAALATTLCATFGAPPAMTLDRVGYGAGKRTWPDRPNLLRVLLGETTRASEHRTVTLIEANIDDANPQVFDYVFQRLFDAGALDVWLTPIVMKKGRPAVTLACLAPDALASELAQVILTETTTLGVRYCEWRRECLEREVETVETPYGAIRVKWALQNGERLRATPEYDDCRAAAAASGVPLMAVMAAAARAAGG